MHPSCLGLCASWTLVRETFYFLDYWFVIFLKRHNSGTARRKTCKGQVLAKACELPCPVQERQLPGTCATSPTRNSLYPAFLGVVFVEPSLQRRQCRNHWPLVADSTSSLSPLPRGRGSGTESFDPQIVTAGNCNPPCHSLDIVSVRAGSD